MEVSTRKIFLVDDDQFLLNMYSAKFAKAGFAVTTETSTAGALAKLREGLTPDVIMLDVVMPGMDGIELLETIRKEKLSPKSLVVMLTNQGQSSEMERAKNLGVTSYIVKANQIPSGVVTTVVGLLAHKKP